MKNSNHDISPYSNKRSTHDKKYPEVAYPIKRSTHDKMSERYSEGTSMDKKRTLKNKPRAFNVFKKLVAIGLIASTIAAGTIIYENVYHSDDIIYTEKENESLSIESAEKDIVSYFDNKFENSEFLLNTLPREVYNKYIVSVIRNVPYLDDYINTYGYSQETLKLLLYSSTEASELSSQISDEELITFLKQIYPFVKKEKNSLDNPFVIHSKSLNEGMAHIQSDVKLKDFESMISQSCRAATNELDISNGKDATSFELSKQKNFMYYLNQFVHDPGTELWKLNKNSDRNEDMLGNIDRNSLNKDDEAVYIEYFKTLNDNFNAISSGEMFEDLKTMSPKKYDLLQSSSKNVFLHIDEKSDIEYPPIDALTKLLVHTFSNSVPYELSDFRKVVSMRLSEDKNLLAEYESISSLSPEEQTTYLDKNSQKTEELQNQLNSKEQGSGLVNIYDGLYKNVSSIVPKFKGYDIKGYDR